MWVKFSIQHLLLFVFHYLVLYVVILVLSLNGATMVHP